MDKYLPRSFWWSLSVLLPYWEEILPCLWNLASIAVLIEDALKLSLGSKLTIFTSHQVKQLLNGRSHLWMLDQWKQWETVFLGSKVTADGDCSHEVKRHLLLGRKAMTNLDSILKSRDIILLIKVCLVKAIVFPVVMYGYESWTIKKAKYRRIDAFELWCWRRLLRVPWTARRSSQSILKEITPK